MDERLGPDEDVEPEREVGRERLPGRVADLEADEVRRVVLQAPQHVERDRVAARAGELVDVERQRRACSRSGGEVGELRLLVEREVRRADHGDRGCTCLRGIGRQSHRVGGRLGTAVGGDVEPAGCCLDEQPQSATALGDREQHPFAVRPEREHAVEAGRDVALDERPERVLVDRGPALEERRHRGSQRPVQDGDARRGVGGVAVERHGATLDCEAAWTRYASNGTTTSSGSSSRGPETRNAFDGAAIAELAEAFVDVGKARAVVLVGEGQSFCAGADIEWMRQSVSLSHDENVADANALRRMFDAIDSCPAPVIAVVQGHALGGGAGLVATADIALAHERAVFGFSEVKLGITPAVISPYVLRKVGESAARRYFVTGERFDAATALRIGLVHDVVLDLEAALEAVLGELRTAGPRAARHAKRLVLERPDGAETARRIAERRASDEGQAGLAAFIERRRPPWAPPLEPDA